jgi:hypothetical protein
VFGSALNIKLGNKYKKRSLRKPILITWLGLRFRFLIKVQICKPFVTVLQLCSILLLDSKIASDWLSPQQWKRVLWIVLIRACREHHRKGKQNKILNTLKEAAMVPYLSNL